jgi:hypothetical protein
MSSVQSKAYWWHTCWFGGLPATVAPQLQAPDEAAALEREAPPVHDSSAILHSIGCRATVGRVKGEKLCFADAKGTRWPWDQLPLPSAVSRTLRLPMHSRASRWYLSLRLMGSSAHMHATCGRMSCGARPHMSAQPPQVLCCRIRLELHTQQNSEVQYDVRVCVCVGGGDIAPSVGPSQQLADQLATAASQPHMFTPCCILSTAHAQKGSAFGAHLIW